MKKHFDWVAIQAYYDKGNSIRECSIEFELSESSFYKAKKRGDFVSRTVTEGVRIAFDKGLIPNNTIGIWTVERRKKQSETAKARGYSDRLTLGNGGRGKKGYYKGYWSDSSYELAWIIYHLDHDIKFERNLERFDYEYKGETKKYIPDFIMPDGSYVEIKGYWVESVDAKMKAFPHEIKLLYKDDIKYIFDYVIKTYGRSFILLYDDTKNIKKCSRCEASVLYSGNKSGVCITCIKANPKPKVLQKYTKTKNCVDCDIPIDKNAKRCEKCMGNAQRKIKTRPSLPILQLQTENCGFVATGKIYGVSDNTIRKWIKQYLAV